MSAVADRRTGRRAVAIAIAAVTFALISQAPYPVPGRRAAGGAPRTESLTAAPSPHFDISVPSAADVRFVGDAGDGPAVATF